MRNKFLLVLLVLALGVLVGCDSAEKTPVSFMVFGDSAELAAYEALVTEFENQHPAIDVALQHIPDQGDYRRRLAAAFSSGEPPDIMLLNYRRFGTFADQGGLEPLSDYMAASEVIAESDFFPITIDSFKWQGDLWCIPQNISSLVVYYNRDLFDVANIPYPSSNWSWDAFLDAARALTQDTDGDGVVDQYGVGIEPNLFRLAPFIWQNGGRLVDNESNPTQLTLDEPVSLDALQWFVDLQVVEGVVPDAAAESAETSQSRFLNGTLGMIFNSRRGVPTYRTIDSFTWDVAPLPFSRRPAGILHSDGYCMAAATENKDAAWTFIEFANSAEGQSIVAPSGRTVPSLRSVAESPLFLNPAQPPANSRVFIDSIPSLGRVPIMSTWIAIEETAGNEIERAFYGQISAEEAARTAISRTQTYFDQNSLQP
ncbi:MAG: sugar ABC transporter substrate-binding protein [Anaerolineae bacterium]|nr:sugar ABC transporter substrate-binding protein [Anaerolineae bacterium]